jgi:hypothetical protein
MKTGKAWRLISRGQRAFTAALVKYFNVGAESVAIFRAIRKSGTIPACQEVSNELFA